MTAINYAPYIRKAAETFQKHGKPNQASILRDAADAFEAMQLQLTHYEVGAEMQIAEEKEQAIIQNIVERKQAIQTVLDAAKAAG
jgi:hypothetical protein